MPLYMCPHDKYYFVPSCSLYYCMFVLILLLMCPHTAICVRILLLMCSQTTIYVSAYYYMFPHTTVYVSAYYYICVRILLCVSSSYSICVLILLHLCQHPSICVRILLYRHSSCVAYAYYYIDIVYVSAYPYMRTHILCIGDATSMHRLRTRTICVRLEVVA